MYKHLHANACNFMTHYIFHTNVERVGAACAGSWLGFANHLGLKEGQESLFEIKNIHWCLKILTEYILCTKCFPRSWTYHVKHDNSGDLYIIDVNNFGKDRWIYLRVFRESKSQVYA